MTTVILLEKSGTAEKKFPDQSKVSDFVEYSIIRHGVVIDPKEQGLNTDYGCEVSSCAGMGVLIRDDQVVWDQANEVFLNGLKVMRRTAKMSHLPKVHAPCHEMLVMSAT